MHLYTAVPYESSIHVKPTLMMICQDCAENYPEACVYSLSDRFCYSDHEWKLWAQKKYGNGETRKLRKRIMWLCPVCDFAYFTRADHHLRLGISQEPVPVSGHLSVHLRHSRTGVHVARFQMPVSRCRRRTGRRNRS